MNLPISNETNKEEKKKTNALISQAIQINLKNKFLKTLQNKEIYNPRKLKIKEFESYIREDLEHLNDMLYQVNFNLKMSFHDTSTNEAILIKRMEESIYMSSLASNILN